MNDQTYGLKGFMPEIQPLQDKFPQDGVVFPDERFPPNFVYPENPEPMLPNVPEDWKREADDIVEKIRKDSYIRRRIIDEIERDRMINPPYRCQV